MAGNMYVKNLYRASAEDFKKIPGSPVAYWVSEKIRETFMKSSKIGTVCEVKNGITSANNDRFLRLWFEVSNYNISLKSENRKAAIMSNKKWFPHNKGGSYRKWFGNCEYILNWKDDGCELFDFRPKSTIRNPDYFFKESLSWSDITSGKLSFRLYPKGFTFDTASNSAFFSDKIKLLQILSLVNNSLIGKIGPILNPTLHYKIGDFIGLPNIYRCDENMIIDIESMIQIAINDWDSYETSWDFTTLPLLTEPYRSPELKTAWSRLRTHWIETTLEMQRLEEENNRIFIAAYGLEDELTPDVPLEEITLTCNPYYRYGNKVEESETSAPPSGITTDSTWPWNSTLEERLRSDTMRELLSYAVGCIFGRYSLDREGLVLANAREGLEEYLKSIPEPALMPDESGILPLTEEDDFSDDLPTQVKDFIKTAFGPDHFDANIRFIEDAMGRDIRSYLLKDFYRDHVQRYKKRHIYWMATSPKGTFRALFYLHRYTPDTVGRLLNDYVRPFMKKLSNKIENDLHQLSFGSLSRADAARTQKRIDKHREALKEIESWEKKVYETATRRIELDLDDGVKVNYGKLIDILEPVKGLDS